MFGRGGNATAIHGTEGTIIVSRQGVWVIPNRGSTLQEAAFENNQEMAQMNVPHWKNWIECIQTRAKPQSEIETCVRSSTACILANLSMRFKTRIDWDEKNWTVQQSEVKPHLTAKYRSPWKLEI